MADLTLIKLGGSLITDKRVERAFRSDRADAIAHAVRSSLDTAADLRLIIGHGSGSFGHMAAKRHGTIRGVAGEEAWRGFAEVALAASALNALVAESFAAAGISVMRFQPSSGTICADGVLTHWDFSNLQAALTAGLVPLVYGDVAFDAVRGGTITSTEALFFYLAERLPVRRILLLGEVEGVLDSAGHLIEHITPATLSDVEAALGGSAGTDVTGGMETKVRDMVELVQRVPGLEVRILDGRDPNRLVRVLTDESSEGTLISD
ncbi:MAG: isopentenyl phosphate kinase [Anaerolineae bacterium]